MDSQENLRRMQRVVRAVAAVLAMLVSIGLWQMYGAWLMSAAGEHGA